MVAYTTTYSFAKPTVGDDEDVWGGYLNGNFDTLESLLKGTTALTAINVTGNITVGGNVDGRDIAADGSKLDGIESGATADQTKSDIDALGINAATLDSLDSTQFLRSDANDSYSGILTGGQLAQGLHPVHSGYYGLWNTTAYASNSQNYMIINAGTDTYITGNNTVYIRGGDNSSTNQLAVTTSGSTIGGNTVWHAGNDGSGSGLDADTVDGIQASSFLRSDAADTLNATMTIASGVNLKYVDKNGTYPTNAGKFEWDLNNDYASIGAQQPASDQIDLTFLITDNASTGTDRYVFWIDDYQGASYDTYPAVMSGTTNYFMMGDNGSGSPDTANARLTIPKTGTVTIDGNTVWHAGNDGSGSGLDADTTDGYQANESSVGSTLAARNSSGYLYANYYNGTGTFSTTGNTSGMARFTGTNGSDTFGRSYTPDAAKAAMGLATTDSPSFAGLNINGNLNAVDNIYVANSLLHEGDTDTYINFQNNLIYINAGNSTNFACAGTYTNVNKSLYNYATYYEGYDALSGTSVTVNCDTAQAFSLTMTGNTTFTFNGVSNVWSTGFVLELTGNGGTVTWPASVDWAGGTAPDAPASGETDIYVFWTRDGGTTWYGVLSVDAAA